MIEGNVNHDNLVINSHNCLVMTPMVTHPYKSMKV